MSYSILIGLCFEQTVIVVSCQNDRRALYWLRIVVIELIHDHRCKLDIDVSGFIVLIFVLINVQICI